jgi:hypothetical protein
MAVMIHLCSGAAGAESPVVLAVYSYCFSWKGMYRPVAEPEGSTKLTSVSWWHEHVCFCLRAVFFVTLLVCDVPSQQWCCGCRVTCYPGSVQLLSELEGHVQACRLTGTQQQRHLGKLATNSFGALFEMNTACMESIQGLNRLGTGSAYHTFDFPTAKLHSGNIVTALCRVSDAPFAGGGRQDVQAGCLPGGAFCCW